MENESKDNANKNFAEEYSFIRKRTHLSRDGRQLGTSYGLTTVHITHSRKHIEVKRIITQREYSAAFKTRDPSRHVVRQKRISFIWNMQSFAVHIYQEPVDVENLCIVHVQQQSGEDEGSGEVELPDFLTVERKLVDDEEDKTRYGAFNISRLEKNDVK